MSSHKYYGCIIPHPTLHLRNALSVYVQHRGHNLAYNEDEIRANLNLLQEVCEVDHIKKYLTKARATRRYNMKVTSRQFKSQDLGAFDLEHVAKFDALMLSGKAYKKLHNEKQKVENF
ncbi:hypothetical protein CR513_62644, partial [Mucuna pruriens]